MRNKLPKPAPYTYDVLIKGNELRSFTEVATNNIVSTFTHPLTSSQFKIYVVMAGEAFLYVGTTKTSLRTRLRNGIKARGENGYHGYKWKNRSRVRLHVWCFEDLTKLQIESVEAELALIIRIKTKLWPESQNEIHFNNSFVPSGQLIAQNLYKQIIANY